MRHVAKFWDKEAQVINNARAYTNFRHLKWLEVWILLSPDNRRHIHTVSTTPSPNPFSSTNKNRNHLPTAELVSYFFHTTDGNTVCHLQKTKALVRWMVHLQDLLNIYSSVKTVEGGNLEGGGGHRRIKGRPGREVEFQGGESWETKLKLNSTKRWKRTGRESPVPPPSQKKEIAKFP